MMALSKMLRRFFVFIRIRIGNLIGKHVWFRFLDGRLRNIRGQIRKWSGLRTGVWFIRNDCHGCFLSGSPIRSHGGLFHAAPMARRP
ncbi:hypothetical protein A6U87_14930 [Rhizobium sp. AC44/96]|nr:hypothetical protein A6U87_14930 [Rhizobium sp. AC44/96]